MTRNEIVALRTLPKHLIKNGTCICEFNNLVFAANPEHTPMQWDVETRVWKECKFVFKDDMPHGKLI